ncbi:hypothetical protein Vadar_029271 [Vaccinium darrowii]|uniref:Uncharacterized protein n=1 Tax=Vaccinium darrowii TaxID=229202 RepID=A0ACB7X4V3_9ERIC|nr:hypothetical protein Vadar_029271 [Vaccinium darrowii]
MTSGSNKYKYLYTAEVMEAKNVGKRKQDMDNTVVHHLFCDSSDNRGFFNFMPLSDLYDASKGFMVNDVVTVEAQITLISSFVDF